MQRKYYVTEYQYILLLVYSRKPFDYAEETFAQQSQIFQNCRVKIILCPGSVKSEPNTREFGNRIKMPTPELQYKQQLI